MHSPFRDTALLRREDVAQGGDLSISSLANSAAARRPDVGPAVAPANTAEIAAAAATPPDKAPAQVQAATGVNTTLNVLFGYIPTEVVTVYVGIATALQPETPEGAPIPPPTGPQWAAFWAFVVLTPLTVWVVYASKLKAAGKPLPLTWATWPIWEMVAALVAFCTWAFALPNTPFREFRDWYSPALASIAVLFASTALGLVAPLFQRELGTGTVPPQVPAKPLVPPSGSAATPPAASP